MDNSIQKDVEVVAKKTNRKPEFLEKLIDLSEEIDLNLFYTIRLNPGFAYWMNEIELQGKKNDEFIKKYNHRYNFKECEDTGYIRGTYNGVKIVFS
jgi:hypothetical protein